MYMSTGFKHYFNQWIKVIGICFSHGNILQQILYNILRTIIMVYMLKTYIKNKKPIYLTLYYSNLSSIYIREKNIDRHSTLMKKMLLLLLLLIWVLFYNIKKFN